MIPYDALSENPAHRRDKLSAAAVEQMRDLVEGTSHSYKRIGAELGVSASTVSRYATAGEWQRPPGAAMPARIARQRDRATEKLWKLAVQHVDTLKAQPVELTRRSLQPLASLTRALGTLTPRNIQAAPPSQKAGSNRPAERVASTRDPEFEIDREQPRRTKRELFEELQGHLDRIEREEAEYMETMVWNFQDGAGI